MTHSAVQPHARGRNPPELAYHYLVQTKPNCESYATQFLTADDFTVYYPRVLVRRAHAGRVDHVPRPLFARYIFVRDDGRGPFYFRSAPGVSGVVTFSDEPSRVGQSIIDRIRAREDDKGFIKLDEDDLAPVPKRFKPGDKVRVDYPVVGSIDGVFRCNLPRDRASVFISLLGRTVRAVVSFADLEHR